MTRLIVLACALLAACDPPSPRLRLAFDSSDVGLCPSSNCMEIPMTCETYVSIRLINPADPTAPFLSQCSQIQQTDRHNICTISSVELDTKEVPLRTLEIQVALFPATEVTTDPLTGDPVCPTDTSYDSSTGFPIASETTPAIGGRAYYHAGDDEVLVNLACTDLDAINAKSCGGGQEDVPVVAKVTDFDFPTPHTGDFTVSVGEPVSSDPFWLLVGSQLHALTSRIGSSGPEWSGTIANPFMTYACANVLDLGPQSTATITCRRTVGQERSFNWPSPPPAGGVDDETHVGTAVWLSKASLDTMLAALGQTTFPAHGLTLGVVLDSTGTPIANQTVVASSGTIQYFQGTNRDSVGGTKTSVSGAFASLDAQFGTIYSVTTGMPLRTISRIGGRVDGKVTIVVLQTTSGGI